MSLKMDYKKRLMEYRKSIKVTTTTFKTVAFKEQSFHTDEDIQFHSSLPLLQTSDFQHHYQQLALQENATVAKYRSATTRSISRTPSPQPQPEILPSLGREGNSLFEPIGRYLNWNRRHDLLASQPWCRIADLMEYCDKYEFKAISVSDLQAHANIVNEVKSLLNGKPPFDLRRRFPGNIHNEGNLLVCIGRCPSIEYHLQRIMNIFRRPLKKLSTDKQNIAKQNFHIAIRELHLDVSARITEVRLYDRAVFEKDFDLRWQDTLE